MPCCSVRTMEATPHGIVQNALLIWPSMNHNETGFLQGTIEGRRSSAIPVCALVREKGKHPFPAASSDAYAEKKLSQHSHRRPTLQVCTSKLNRRSPSLLGEMFRLLTCVLFNIGGSLIGGVNFRPPGQAGR
jgi:hypothetical protein